MKRLAQITRQHLLKTVGNFPTKLRNDDSKRSFWLSVAVIKYFFGEEWIEEHLSPQRATDGFLRVVPGEAADTQISAFKIVDFAELLYNLQHIPGFYVCIDRIRRGTLEPTYAELDFGRMLYCGGVEFRFVEPQQQKGLDYDIEIRLPDGVLVSADAKCKVDSTDFSVDTVRRSLEKARTQFPRDRPSIIFLKVPDRWIEQPLFGASLNEIAVQFLRGTGRIVSVKFYFSRSIYRNKAEVDPIGRTTGIVFLIGNLAVPIS
jgi:hypothetical protein